MTGNVELTEAVKAEKSVQLILNGNTLTTNGLDFAAGAVIENGTIKSADNTNMVPHLKVSGGKLEMTDVTVQIDKYLNYQAQGNRAYSEYSGLEINNAKAVLNNCYIKVENDTYLTWSYVYGITLNKGTLEMNGGSVVVKSAGASVTDLRTAIGAIDVCTVTLNNVAVDAATYGMTMGHLTLKTTDKNVTDADFVSYNSGTYELVVID